MKTKTRISVSVNKDLFEVLEEEFRNKSKYIFGFLSLFAGIEVAVVRAFPANAALFVGYELSRKLMLW